MPRGVYDRSKNKSTVKKASKKTAKAAKSASASGVLFSTTTPKTGLASKSYDESLHDSVMRFQVLNSYLSNLIGVASINLQTPDGVDGVSQRIKSTAARIDVLMQSMVPLPQDTPLDSKEETVSTKTVEATTPVKEAKGKPGPKPGYKRKKLNDTAEAIMAAEQGNGEASLMSEPVASPSPSNGTTVAFNPPPAPPVRA